MKNKIAAMLCSFLIIGALACNSHKTTGHSRLSATVGARSVATDVDGPAWIKPGDDKITVTVTGHEIVIESERVVVDGRERAKAPAGAKTFQINVLDGRIAVKADDSEILNAPLEK